MRSFITGLLIGILGTGYYFYKGEEAPVNDVKVTQVSGEKIEHKGFSYKGSSITFGTEAKGKGEILTEIPKINIPEAKAWIQNTNAVMIEAQLTDRRIYGLSYLKRWDKFSAGGGVLVSEEKFEGVKIQAQYWFGL